MKIKKLGALLVSVALCAGMAAPAFAYGGEPVEEVEQPVLTSTTDEEDVVTVTDEETGALTPEGNLTLVDDYHTDYSDGSGQQFITLVSKSGATFYLVIDRNAKGQQTVHFMNLVDEADLLALMEEDAADAYTAEKEAAAQAELDRLKAEEEAKKAAEEAAASGEEQPKENKVTKIASGFLGVVVLIALAAGGGFYVFAKQKQKKQAEKEALDPDANYTEDKGDFEIPVDADLEEFRKNPEVDLDFTIEDLHRETVDEPTQYIPAVHTVSKAQKVQEADDEEEEEASPHKLGTRKLLTIIGAAVAAVALIVLLWHAIFSDLLGGEQTPTEYVVPYLIGMTIDEANEDENVKGIFTIEQIGQRASSKYAAGQIIEQSPERGKTVKGNRVISVFVSSGAKTEKMPNLVNKEYRDATLQLTNLDLNLVVNDPVEEYSSITKGYVIRTIPEFGETLQEGDSVTLVVSKGEQPKPVTVLSFIGIDIEIVRQQVTQTGLVVGEVKQRASDEPYGTVIDQSINAETKVDAGTTINFVISEGPAMPDYGDDATTSGGEPQP